MCTQREDEDLDTNLPCRAGACRCVCARVGREQLWLAKLSAQLHHGASEQDGVRPEQCTAFICQHLGLNSCGALGTANTDVHVFRLSCLGAINACDNYHFCLLFILFILSFLFKYVRGRVGTRSALLAGCSTRHHGSWSRACAGLCHVGPCPHRRAASAAACSLL